MNIINYLKVKAVDFALFMSVHDERINTGEAYENLTYEMDDIKSDRHSYIKNAVSSAAAIFVLSAISFAIIIVSARLKIML